MITSSSNGRLHVTSSSVNTTVLSDLLLERICSNNESNNSFHTNNKPRARMQIYANDMQNVQAGCGFIILVCKVYTLPCIQVKSHAYMQIYASNAHNR